MGSEWPRIGVGAIAVRDECLLMVRRAKQPALGLWSLPGGHLERGEYLSDAVRREVREETGIEVDVRALAGIFEVPGATHYVILDYVVDLVGDATPRSGDDVSDARWVGFDDVLELECTPRFVETLRGWGVLP
jgi:8-oxo-dGTP diphosphatase